MEARTFELEFAKFIQRFHQPIKETFIEDTLDKRGLLAYYPAAKSMLDELADDVLKVFTANVDRRTSSEAIAQRYIQLGKDCRDRGVSYADMVRSLTLLKRHIWIFFQESNFAGQPFDVRSIVALNNRTALFFDRAIYHFLLGYEQQPKHVPSEIEALYEAFLDKVRRDLAAGRETPG
jgi:hypothetical protein